MNQTAISAITARQRRFFDTGVTLDIRYRMAALKRLQKAVTEHESELTAALRHDLGKSDVEGYLCEIGMVRAKLRRLLRSLKRLTRDRRVPLYQFPARTIQRPTPYGVTLILSPWCDPVLLTLGPLADALAAGNTAVVKPSAYAPATSRLLARLLGGIFPAAYVEVLEGSREANAWLLGEKFDYIYFTGSKKMGKLVLEQAAKHLTPVTLELGSKNPCIIHSSADLASAARKVVFGKFLNCGQSCTAPDYVLCDETVREEFLWHLRLEIHRQYGKEYKYNLSYGRIVSKKHFDRLLGLIDGEKVFVGGASDREALRIEPTVLTDVTWEDPVMDAEIFGPILPVLTFRNAGEIIDTIRTQAAPPVLYVFAKDRTFINRITRQRHFGSCGINDVIVHPSAGGPGNRHQTGFHSFSRCQTIVRGRPLDLPIRYQPHTKLSEKIIRFFLR